MKTGIWILTGLLFTVALSAQDRGIIPVAGEQAAGSQPNSARAVVVGISDYQDRNIPDLNFAHRDAEAFAAWLQSPAGGKVPSDNILLLTNEKATTSQIYLAVWWLLEETRENDLAIIYFSGHGDVETKSIRQKGYLLTYDSPADVYVASSLKLDELEDYIVTLSSQNKGRVLVVTDACHAGKLAGSNIRGTQLLNNELNRQYDKEVKIMSCQPSEFSIEGLQWGGGRGVFSYHLVEGLTGLADKNADGIVSLFEIRRYLEDIVPVETAPYPQMPLTIGDPNAPIARVDKEAIALLRKAKEEVAANLNPLNMKGLEEEVLALADSIPRLQYEAFCNALKTGDLLGPASADFYYSILIENDTLKPLLGLMTRNFAAALADEAQQALNAILTDDPYEIRDWVSKPSKYKIYPLYLQRALELIGEKNYLYRSLMAKKLYFEGFNIYNNLGVYQEQPAVRDSFRREAKKLFLRCLEYEPYAAYACFGIASLIDRTGNQTISDSCIFWLKRAIELAPNWKQPYVSIAEVYLNWLTIPEEAEPWLMKAYAMDTTSYMLLQELAWLRQYQHRPEEANAICRKMIDLRPDIPDAYYTMRYTQFFLQGKVSEAHDNFEKASELEKERWPNWIHSLRSCDVPYLLRTRQQDEALLCLEEAEIDSVSATIRSNYYVELSNVFLLQRNLEKAAEAIQKGKEICIVQEDMSILEANRGRLLLLQGKPGEAEQALLNALAISESPISAWIGVWALLGSIKAAQDQPAEAEVFFQKAVNFWGGNTANYCWEEAWFLYGRFLLDQNRDAEAFHAFEKVEEVFPNGYFAPYGFALFEAKQGNRKAALDWLERSLDRYYPIPQPILEEPLFKKLWKTKRFKDMMEKNFSPG